MSLISFDKALKEITEEARPDRARKYYYDKKKCSQDSLAQLKLEIWERKGITPHEIQKERDEYMNHKALEAHAKGGPRSAKKKVSKAPLIKGSQTVESTKETNVRSKALRQQSALAREQGDAALADHYERLARESEA